jgi:hypothetical protein
MERDVVATCGSFPRKKTVHRTCWALVGFLGFSCLSLAAQSTPDFSGRWSLSVAPATAERGIQSLDIDAAEELLVNHSATSITVQHSAKRGSHPKAGTHAFGSHGLVGSAANGFEAHAFWFGHQLIIGTTYTDVDADGRKRTIESSEMWSLDSAGHLVIEIAESQTAVGRRTATLLYRSR